MKCLNPVNAPVSALLGLMLLACSGVVAADALTTLNDAELFKKAQADVAQLPHAELDALTQAVTSCAAVSLGQRPQHFECERGVYAWWTRYNRGRSLDSFVSSLGSLFAAFDNNSLNPSGPMLDTYKKTSVDLVALTNAINQRYRQLDK